MTRTKRMTRREKDQNATFYINMGLIFLAFAIFAIATLLRGS